LAGTHPAEKQTGRSIKKFVRTTRRCRTVNTRAGGHIFTPKTRYQAQLRDALAIIT
jgi:hypothetical protein